MIYIGIDPGKTGGITIMQISDDGWKKIKSLDIHMMPQTEQDIMKVFSEVVMKGIYTKATIEAQHAFPGMGAKAQWTFAQHYGFLRGVLVSLAIPFTEVSPQTWMAYFGFKRKKGEDKKLHKTRILQKAQNLYPQSSVALQTADSLMLCEYLRLTEKGV